jgi:4-amino-4-deoxy-L-arabinose transferase-like glycosyltransferase
MGGADSGLVSYLEKHQDGAKWLIAVPNSQSAGQLILSTGKPVISMFGFTGSDNAMTLAKLKELVKKGELHYIQLGNGGGPGGGGNSLLSEITTWVQKNGTAVKESEYSPTSTSEAGSETGSEADTSNTSNTSNTSTVYRLDASDVS